MKKFKPFDKVIFLLTGGVDVDLEHDVWTCALFSHETEDAYFLANGGWLSKDEYELLPFDGNEHLLGTRNAPTE